MHDSRIQPRRIVQKECTCTAVMVSKYQKRISGPLLDSIDIHLEAVRVPIPNLPVLERDERASAVW